MQFKTENRNNVIFSLAERLSKLNNHAEMVRLVTQTTIPYFNADSISLILVSPLSGESIKTAYLDGAVAEKKQERLIRRFISGWVMNNAAPLHSENILQDSRFKIAISSTDSISSIAAPLQIEAKVFGILIALRKTGSTPFTKRHVNEIANLSLVIAPYLFNREVISKYFSQPADNNMLIAKYNAAGIIGKHSKTVEMMHSIEKAAATDVSVILEGKSGTGKERVAKSIHHFSMRSGNRFIAIDCGAITETLFESEMFGHSKGAFTGAHKEKIGFIEQADKGTLFLDEISNMPYELQSKLLRVLEERTFRRVGSEAEISFDIRLICASSTPLQKLVSEGKFREDLFYRIYVYPVFIPALTERRSDIPILALHFLHQFNASQNKSISDLHPLIMEYLKNREWAGNIRQLRNTIERLVTLAGLNQQTISKKHIPTDLLSDFESVINQQGNFLLQPLSQTIAKTEQEQISLALELADGNQRKAARLLNISEGSLRSKIKRHGMRRDGRHDD